MLRLFCRHEYEFYADFSWNEKKVRYGKVAKEYLESTHRLTIRCKKCGKLKNLTPYTKETELQR